MVEDAVRTTMASRLLGRSNRSAILLIIWFGIFVAFTTVGVALAVTVNIGIFFVFVALGLSFSTMAVDSVKAKSRGTAGRQRFPRSPVLCLPKMETHAPFFAEEMITIYPPCTAMPNPCLCTRPKATAMRSSSAPRLYLCNEQRWPSVQVTRQPTTLAASAVLRSAPVAHSASRRDNSSDGVRCEDVRSLSYHRPYSCYEKRSIHRVYDEYLDQDRYRATEGFLAIDDMKTPKGRRPDEESEKKRATRLTETKGVSFDIRSGDDDNAVQGECRKATDVFRSVSSTSDDRNAEGPSETYTPTSKAGEEAFDGEKGGGSDVSQGTDEKSSSEGSADLKPKRSDVPHKVVRTSSSGTSVPDEGTLKRRGNLKGADMQPALVIPSSRREGEERVNPDTDGTRPALSIPVPSLGPLEFNEFAVTNADQGLGELQMRDKSRHQRSKSSLRNNGVTRKSKSVIFSTPDEAHLDADDTVIGQDTPRVNETESQTDIVMHDTEGGSGCVVRPLVEVRTVEMTIINNQLNREASQLNFCEAAASNEVPSLSGYAQATVATRNKAVQRNEYRVDVQTSAGPKKKKLSGRLPMFLRPCKRK